MKRRDFLVAGGTLAASLALPARAAYPDKPVRYYIAFAPGGESDIAARLQQQVFRRKFGQEVVIDSKPGAGGALAWSQLNQFPGDGYTLMGTNLPHLVLQPLEGNVQYQTDDIINVIFFNYTPDAIVVRSESPFRTYQDFIKAAKARPGALNLAGSGTNSANHAAHARLNAAAGIETTYVAFKGTGDLIASLLGGHVDGAVSYSSLAVAQKGKTRCLAVATPQRLPYFPDVPTFRELGVDWVDGAYRGIGVPKSTSPEQRKRLSDLWRALNNDAEMKELAAKNGFELVNVGMEEMDAFMAGKTKLYTEGAARMGLGKK